MTDIHVEEREPEPVLSIRQTIPVSELTQAQGASLHELWRLLRDRGIAPAGPPFVRYHTFGEAETDVETGVPVSAKVEGAGRVTASELPGGRAIRTEHLGGHDRLGEAYGRIQEWLDTRGTARGPAWEVYEWIDLTRDPDPATWAPPAEWRTQLVQPIA